VDVVVDVKAIVAWVVVVAGSDSLGVQAEARSPKASIDKRKRRIGEEYRRPTTDDRRPTRDCTISSIHAEFLSPCGEGRQSSVSDDAGG
jgi:hypothetical protein